jgi:hypothetical protein
MVFQYKVTEKGILDPRERKQQKAGTIHTEELHNLQFSPNTVNLIRSRRLIWAEHYKGQNHLEDQVIDEMITLIFLIQKRGVKYGVN